MKNYYRTLGISETATEKEIRTAYRQLALKYHPDRNPSPDAAAKFIELQEAYETLGNEQGRAAYDNMRQWQRQGGQSRTTYQNTEDNTYTYARRTYTERPAKRQSVGINWLRFIIPAIVIANLFRQCVNSSEPTYTTMQYNKASGTSYFIDSSGTLHGTTNKPDSSNFYKPVPLK